MQQCYTTFYEIASMIFDYENLNKTLFLNYIHVSDKLRHYIVD